jgi:hypothetical protein
VKTTTVLSAAGAARARTPQDAGLKAISSPIFNISKWNSRSSSHWRALSHASKFNAPPLIKFRAVSKNDSHYRNEPQTNFPGKLTPG